jgi:hypothetical protein
MDDILHIWRPDPSNPWALNHSEVLLQQTPALMWTFEFHPYEVNFLDL